MSTVGSHPDSLGFDVTDEEFLSRVRRATAVDPGGRLGPYELLEEIGRGGQGAVYKARQPGTGRIIALKRVTSVSSGSTSFRARFDREVRAAGALNHPHFVTVYGCDHIDDVPLLLMEHIEGVSVDRWSAQIGEGVERILELFEKICRAVFHAHQRGVIHRDLKPSNVLVDSAGEPHVLDFGLARLLSPSFDVMATQTHSTGYVGTPAYSSPEQLGLEDGALDVRSDVFSAGCMLYQALTGRLPHGGGGSMAAVIKSIEEEVPRPPSALRPGLARDIDAIVLKALAKRMDDRYPSMDALADDIRRYLSGRPVLAYPPSAWYQARKLMRRHRTSFVAASAVTLLIIAFSVTVTILAVRERAARVEGEWRTYTASLAAASAAIRAEDFAAARANLALAPRELRNWEWRHLAAQADQSESSRDTGCTVVAIDPNGVPILGANGPEIITYSAPGEGTAAQTNLPAARTAAEIFASDQVDIVVSHDLRTWIRRPLPSDGLSLSGRVIEDIQTRRVLARLTPPAARFTIARLTWDDRFVIAKGEDGVLLVAGLDGLRGSPSPSSLKWESYRLHEGFISAVALASDGRTIASGAGDRRIQIFDLTERGILRTIVTGERSVSSLAFSSDCRRLACGSWDKRVTLWNLETGESIWTAGGQRELVSALAFSSDGRWIASGAWDKTIHVYDAMTGRIIQRLIGHSAEVSGLAFLKVDGQQSVAELGPRGCLVSFDRAGILKTWRIGTDEGLDCAAGEFRWIVAFA